jgi:hypothetical protein
MQIEFTGRKPEGDGVVIWKSAGPNPRSPIRRVELSSRLEPGLINRRN